MKKSNIYNNPLLLIITIVVLLTQCTSPTERITTKIVTVKDGIPTEEISYLNDAHLEFEILPLGEDESFLVTQQIKKLNWSRGEPNAEITYIIEDSVSQVNPDVIIPAKEFQNRNEFLKFMASKGYVMSGEDKRENKISFDRKKVNIKTSY